MNQNKVSINYLFTVFTLSCLTLVFFYFKINLFIALSIFLSLPLFSTIWLYSYHQVEKLKRIQIRILGIKASLQLICPCYFLARFSYSVRRAKVLCCRENVCAKLTHAQLLCSVLKITVLTGVLLSYCMPQLSY